MGRFGTNLELNFEQDCTVCNSWCLFCVLYHQYYVCFQLFHVVEIVQRMPIVTLMQINASVRNALVAIHTHHAPVSIFISFSLPVFLRHWLQKYVTKEKISVMSDSLCFVFVFFTHQCTDLYINEIIFTYYNPSLLITTTLQIINVCYLIISASETMLLEAIRLSNQFPKILVI